MMLSLEQLLFVSGELEYAARCFQALLMKDKHHSGVLINYGALLLCKYGSVVACMGI